MPSQVYFIRTVDGEADESVAEKAAVLYEKAAFAKQLEKGQLVGIKQHFGEKGGDGWLRPPIAKRFVELVKKTGAKPFLTDTSTLYKGHRGTAVDYLNLCRDHGFTHETVGCPVIIADGLVGASQVFVRIDGKHYRDVPIAADAYHAFAFLVLTHVTGHLVGGLGASIKNVAMGLSSRAGKLSQHHGDIPIVDPKKCTACGRCEHLCPADAIAVGETAVISREKCIGCGECLAVCPFGAVGFHDGMKLTTLPRTQTRCPFISRVTERQGTTAISCFCADSALGEAASGAAPEPPVTVMLFASTRFN